MNKIYNILSIPTLILHELLHVIVCLLVLSRWKGLLIERLEHFDTTFGVKVTIFSVSKHKWQNLLIHMAPFLAILVGPLVGIYYGWVIGFVVIGYQLITSPLLVPSREDFEAINKFKTPKELLKEIQ